MLVVRVVTASGHRARAPRRENSASVPGDKRTSRAVCSKREMGLLEIAHRERMTHTGAEGEDRRSAASIEHACRAIGARGTASDVRG